MPQQTVFDLDGRQAVDKLNSALEDDVSNLQAKLQNCEANNMALEIERDDLKAEVEKLKDQFKEMQKDLKRLTKYDLSEGGCDESTCNASMKPHTQGDYVTWSEVERICEI